jgi:hypothetical protein
MAHTRFVHPDAWSPPGGDAGVVDKLADESRDHSEALVVTVVRGDDLLFNPVFGECTADTACRVGVGPSAWSRPAALCARHISGALLLRCEALLCGMGGVAPPAHVDARVGCVAEETSRCMRRWRGVPSSCLALLIAIRLYCICVWNIGAAIVRTSALWRAAACWTVPLSLHRVVSRPCRVHPQLPLLAPAPAIHAFTCLSRAIFERGAREATAV